MLRALRVSLGVVSLSLLATLGAPTANAAEAPPPRIKPTRISPLASMMLAHRASTGKTLPWLERNEAFEADGLLPVVVRFAHEPTASELTALRASGAGFEQRPAAVADKTFLARITADGLRALTAAPNVASVDPDVRVKGPLPLDQSRIETRVDQAVRAARVNLKDGTPLDGTGTSIVDIDTTVFLFHPALFRGDGGYSAWIDVNANGKFDPDVDGVDLDGDGAIAKEEVLHVLSSRVISAYGPELDRDVGFTPALDFLYCDTNGNGSRDYGAGFTEDTPAYGEPLFVVDDANADGAVGPSERFIRLKTSKLAALRDGTKTYTRGDMKGSGLVNYEFKSAAQMSDASHGTAVAGILVGGVPGVSRWLGLAPNADLYVATSSSEPSAAIQWALARKPAVILTEYAPYAGVTLDGSSNEDSLYDGALAKGTVIVSPAGNLATSKKHRSLTLAAGTNTITLLTDKHFQGATLIQLSLHQRGAPRKIALSVKTPDGKTVDVPADGTNGIDLGDGRQLLSYPYTTPRGTNESHVFLYAPQSSLPQGTYTVTATVDAGPPVEIDAYTGDDRTSWQAGITFEQGDPARTICSPSTGDKTISVGAYVLHDEPSFYATAAKGDLASYSSRGPRIDGEPKLGIAAPENPISLSPPSANGVEVEYSPFGGTSGAGPHVAASVALLQQLYPTERAEVRKNRILSSGRRDSFVKDATLWGEGKLDLAKAAELSIADGAPPKVRIKAVTPAYAGTPVKLSVEILDGTSPDKLTARWDFDYDGVPDTSWGGLEIDMPSTEDTRRMNPRVEVLDANGNIAADTLLVDLNDGKPPVVGATGPADSSDDGCGCSVPGHDTGALRTGALAVLAAGVMVARRRRKTVDAA
ncbi:peptidase S8 and S53, subtilisin, kexin, sedolisin [Labilithrix luteola]|uniref:Peptidase S8 and S53, subtilisin, kexin, sedolisin n=1 Tax=Labilithrix luteola TaxID=1391654 RepID=A0A0K1PV94_9BACT|nr:S8 family serine peptidase [Labilithrix luteola]AKU97450.1 peptidase S8 and S53, subtilisin, kexin, sedolisin [Labilithrix luteola]